MSREAKLGEGSSSGSISCVWIAITAAYAIVILLLAYFGFFGYIYKAVILPALVIIAVLLRRLRMFIRDWSVFLAAMFLADSIRGLIYAMVHRFELPVYMNYAIAWERTLLGGSTLPEILQRAWLDPEKIGPFERFLVIAHASHFLVFLFFALLIWLTRSAHFGRFKLAMVLTIYVGMLGYLLVPTVPPWMASSNFEALPPITYISTAVYNVAVPNLEHYFATNPIAAMPSLHAAFPTLLSLAGYYHFGWRTWPVFLYAGLVFLAITYLGEHYLVDVLAGVLLAGACYVAVYHMDRFWRLFLRNSRSAQSDKNSPWFEAERAAPRAATAPRPVAERYPGLTFLLTVILLLVAEAAGLWAQNHFGPYSPSLAFVEQELDGRSPTASLFRGRHAFLRGDFATAQKELTRAAGEVNVWRNRRRARCLLGQSAFQNQDWETAAQNLELFPLAALGPETGLELVEAQIKMGRHDEGFRSLEELGRLFGETSQLLTSKNKLQYEYGRISTEEYRERMQNAHLATPPPQQDGVAKQNAYCASFYYGESE